jgi:hypothetical protein
VQRKAAESLPREADDVALGEATRPESDPALELLDVPAAVVCALCGDPACPGCADFEEPTNASGIVAIVPWERPGTGVAHRMWSTARLATLSAESFFAGLPDGDVTTAFRFALASELLAVLGMGVVAVPLVLAFAPWLFELIGRDPWMRQLTLRIVGFGVPALAIAMVAIHSLHGFCLDLGARRLGAKARPTRGLRFGLYSCGWDLVTLPAGLAMLAITDGFSAARTAIPLSMTVPKKATRAFLRGVHRLDEEGARRASRTAAMVAGGLVLAGALAAGVTVAALVLL